MRRWRKANAAVPTPPDPCQSRGAGISPATDEQTACPMPFRSPKPFGFPIQSLTGKTMTDEIDTEPAPISRLTTDSHIRFRLFPDNSAVMRNTSVSPMHDCGTEHNWLGRV